MELIKVQNINLTLNNTNFFQQLNFVVFEQRCGMLGLPGSGKSLLTQLLTRKIEVHSSIILPASIYCVNELNSGIDFSKLKNHDLFSLFSKSNRNYNKKLEIIYAILNYDYLIFDDCFCGFLKSEKNTIFEYLKKMKKPFLLITSNVEELIYIDYCYILHQQNIIMEGKLDLILKEETILKRLGIGLPFITDLSIQLGYYNLTEKIYSSKEELVGDLWNK